jgi:hypothetical protein
MSFSGLGLAGTLEALDACGRLAAVVPSLANWHEIAAEHAREDWTGPHRDTFDDVFQFVQQSLADAALWLASVRAALDAHVEVAIAADRAAKLHLAIVNDR